MNDLDVRAVVAADFHGLQHHMVVRVHGTDMQPVAAEQQHVRRQLEGRTARPRRQLEMHLDIGTRQQLAILVVDDELREQRAGRCIDGTRSAVERGGVGFARTVRENQIGLQARLHAGGIRLRHGHVQAQPVHVSNPE